MLENQEQYQKLSNDSTAEECTAPEYTTTPVLPSAPTIKARDKHKNVLFSLGITECVMGGLSIVFAIATLVTDGSLRFGYYSLLTYTSQGLWCGILLVVTGNLGRRAKKNSSVGMYKTNMVLSILTAIFTPIGFVLSGFAADLSYRLPLFPLHALITLLLIGGFIISIIHSAFCCAGLFGQRNHPATVVYIPQAPNSQQIGGIPNVQYVMPAGAPSIQQHYNAQLMQPVVVHHQVQVAAPPQTVYTNQGISPSAQYSGAQYVPHV